MKGAGLSDEALMAALRSHPELRKRVSSIVSAVEGDAGELKESYKLPSNYNEAYGLIGDGVAVAVVRHLAEHILEPILRNRGSGRCWPSSTKTGSRGPHPTPTREV